MPTDPFPEDEQKEGEEPKRIAALLNTAEHEDVLFVVEAFNTMHRALGRKGREWAVMSLTKRMVLWGVETFLRQYGGWPSWDEKKKRPMSAEEKAAFLKRVVADVTKKK